MSTAMRALRHERYGTPPEVLRVRDVDVPEPREGEVLLRVRAASVNPVDWHTVRGEPFVLRVANGIRRPRDGGVGLDAAGIVEAVGPGDVDLRPGDEVLGHANGSLAELARAKAARLARKPPSLTFEQAASLPVAGGTALHALVTHGRLQKGQRVLIVGAAGGVGSFAVQIAKALGGEVTGVCSTANVDFVRALGADHVVDYTRDDVTTRRERYDLVVQLAGDTSLSALRRLLTPHGTLVLAGSGTGRDGGGGMLAALRELIRSRLLTLLTGQTVKMFLSSTAREHLETLIGFVERGELTPHVEATFPLERAAEALTRIESGHTRGKLAITVSH